MALFGRLRSPSAMFGLIPEGAIAWTPILAAPLD